MGTDQQSKRPSTRRYTPAEKEQAVRLVRQLRKELGADQGTVGRVARQLGYGVESVRSWVKQADIDDGNKPGTITAEAERNQGAGAGEQGARAVQRDPSPGFGISRPGGARPPTEVTAPHRREPGRARGRVHLQGAAGGPEHLLRSEVPASLGRALRDRTDHAVLSGRRRWSLRVPGIQISELVVLRPVPQHRAQFDRWPNGRPRPEVPDCVQVLSSMISGMTTTKIAVSLPAGLVDQAQRAVAEGRASSVSAYVARALEEQAKLDDLASLLDEMLAETGGPLTASERKNADRALGR